MKRQGKYFILIILLILSFQSFFVIGLYDGYLKENNLSHERLFEENDKYFIEYKNGSIEEISEELYEKLYLGGNITGLSVLVSFFSFAIIGFVFIVPKSLGRNQDE